MKTKVTFRLFSISLSWLWIGALVLLPCLLLLLTSLIAENDGSFQHLHITVDGYLQSFDTLYLPVFLRSLKIAFITTMVCLLLAFPCAYFIARSSKRWQRWLLLLTIIPFWTNSIITTYAIMIIVKSKGLINSVLLYLGIIHHPLQLLYSSTAVYIGLVYNLLPLMILPLYARLEKLDQRQLEAACDLGASTWKTWRHIIIPFSRPAIVAGCLFVFLPALTLFFIPDLLGGAKSYMLGNLIEDQFISQQNWRFGASLSVLLTLFAASLIAIYWRLSKNTHRDELL